MEWTHEKWKDFFYKLKHEKAFPLRISLFDFVVCISYQIHIFVCYTLQSPPRQQEAEMVEKERKQQRRWWIVKVLRIPWSVPPTTVIQLEKVDGDVITSRWLAGLCSVSVEKCNEKFPPYFYLNINNVGALQLLEATQLLQILTDRYRNIRFLLGDSSPL